MKYCTEMELAMYQGHSEQGTASRQSILANDVVFPLAIDADL